VILAVLTLMFLFLLAGCSGGEDKLAVGGRDVRGTTTTAELRSIPMTVPATGSLIAQQVINISTRMMGWIREVHVDEGDWVAKGDPLITIDNSDLIAKRAQTEAAIIEAQAVLTNAEKMVERFQKLYTENSVSKQQLDDVITGRDRATAGLRTAQAMRDEVDVHLSYLEIKAPMAGLVTRKTAEAGNMANPGASLLVLEKTAQMKVVARLGEKHISSVKLGDMITVDITSLPGAKYIVPIEEVIHSANPGSRTYDIEAIIDNPDGRLKSGMFARVEVPVGERKAVMVPSASIIERGQLRGLFIVDANGVARLRWVRLGTDFGHEVEILAGVDSGETIVVTADEPLVEGDKVVR
jgi:RND family efflux transporter MFP subunit